MGYTTFIFAPMSEGFIVSARKYRPQNWDTVVGQKSITTTLQNAIATGKIAHAYLFTGPRGVGKTTCARIFARAINQMIEASEQDVAFNIFELDAASNNSVEDIRSLVESVRIPPQKGQYKVYIIDEVHMLSSAAFNAFLKTLEEPPAHAIFILATTEKHKIIPTILSRCQVYDFARIKVKDTVDHLQSIARNEGIEAETEALHVIAQKADGAMRDALSIFDQVVAFCGRQLTYQAVIQNLNVLDHDYYFRITDYILKEDIPGSLILFDEVLSKGFDGHHFIYGLGQHFRNLMVSKDPQTTTLLETSDSVAAQYAEQASRADLITLVRGLDIINTCDTQYRLSKHQRLLVELALMQLCSIAYNKGEGEKKKYRLRPFRSEGSMERLNPSKPQSAKDEQGKTQHTGVAETVTLHPPVPVSAAAQRRESVNKLSRVLESPHSFSIKKALTKAQASNTEPGSVEELSPSSAENAAVEISLLHQAWQEFASTQKLKSQGLYNTLKSHTPEMTAPGTLSLKLHNAVQELDVSVIKSDLLAFLRKKTGVTFSLVMEQLPTEQRKAVYKTNRERFEDMAKENPALETLRNAFKLHLDN